MKTPKFFRQISPLVVFAALASGYSVKAADVNWTGLGSDGKWSTAANWSTVSTLPAGSDRALFNGDGNGYTTIAVGSTLRSINSIIFDSANCASYTIGSAGEGCALATGGVVTMNAGVTNDQYILANIRRGGGASTAFTNSSTSATLFLSGTISKVSSNNDETFVVQGAGNTSIGGIITNNPAAGFVTNFKKAQAGTVTLSGNNVYLGTTTHAGGALLINGDTSAATGAVTVTGTGGFKSTLGGTGIIGGATTISGSTSATSSTLSAGTVDAVGKLTFSKSLTISNNNVDTIFQIDGTSRGVTFDAIDLGLNQTLTYGGKLTLDVSTALNAATYDLFSFTDGFNAGSLSSVVFTGGTYDGVLFSGASGIWTASQGATSFTFSEATGDLIVAVPEPQTWAMLVGGVATLVALRRRMRA